MPLATSKHYEIVGCSPRNFGDVLMLEAVVQHLRERLPQWRPCVRDLRVRSAAQQPNEIGLVAPPSRGPFRDLLQRVRSFAREGIASPSFVEDNNISALIDVCGYKYGGLWGNEALIADQVQYREATTRGRRVILMPKTFGPFRHTGSQVRDLVRHVTACFVRDSESAEHLVAEGLAPGRDFDQFPDFTTDVDGTDDGAPRAEFGTILVPNINMIKAGMFRDANEYVEYLAMVGRAIARLGRPGVLLHHIGSDRELCQQLSAALRTSVIEVSHARQAKAIIARARLLYSDRLHGVIGGLSQAVPTLTSGWSHKYVELLRDWNALSFALVDSRKGANEIEAKIMLASEKEAEIRALLARARLNIQERNRAMWDRVVALLD